MEGVDNRERREPPAKVHEGRLAHERRIALEIEGIINDLERHPDRLAEVASQRPLARAAAGEDDSRLSRRSEKGGGFITDDGIVGILQAPRIML